jgi:hypothetical protein
VNPVAGPHLATAADNLGKRFGRKAKAAAAESPTTVKGGATPSHPATGGFSVAPAAARLTGGKMNVAASHTSVMARQTTLT